MANLTLECPDCGADVVVPEGHDCVECPNCHTIWSVEIDGEYDAEGKARDLSSLHSPLRRSEMTDADKRAEVDSI